MSASAKAAFAAATWLFATTVLAKNIPYRAAQMTERFKPQYDTRGYVIVPSLIRADEFDNLRTAATRTIDKTRTGEWPHRRTVGRQFPPYDNDHPDSWGVQHLMHPDLGEPAFAEWYTSDSLLEVVKELLECEEDELQMGECIFYGPEFVSFCGTR